MVAKKVKAVPLSKMLSTIDKFLLMPQGNRLWNVLSALRGPDINGMEDLKQETTAVIRVKAFPKATAPGCPLSAVVDLNYSGTLDDAKASAEVRTVDMAHFGYHIIDAISALKSAKKK